jgi:hypothetical protein
VSILEGINEKTPKATLLDRLRTAAKSLAGYEDERVRKMQEIEERVRATLKPVDLRQIIVSSSVEEWQATADFLDEFEGFLPASLARLREGIKQVAEDDTA